MHDSYGDGWSESVAENATNAITIFANGNSVVSNATFHSGGKRTIQFEVSQGDCLKVQFINGGMGYPAYAEEASYSIVDADGKIILRDMSSGLHRFPVQHARVACDNLKGCSCSNRPDPSCPEIRSQNPSADRRFCGKPLVGRTGMFKETKRSNGSGIRGEQGSEFLKFQAWEASSLLDCGQECFDSQECASFSFIERRKRQSDMLSCFLYNSSAAVLMNATATAKGFVHFTKNSDSYHVKTACVETTTASTTATSTATLTATTTATRTVTTPENNGYTCAEDSRGFFTKLDAYYPPKGSRNEGKREMLQEQCKCWDGTSRTYKMVNEFSGNWIDLDASNERRHRCNRYRDTTGKCCFFEESHAGNAADDASALFTALKEVGEHYFSNDTNFRSFDVSRRVWLAEKKRVSSSTVVLITMSVLHPPPPPPSCAHQEKGWPVA